MEVAGPSQASTCSGPTILFIVRTKPGAMEQRENNLLIKLFSPLQIRHIMWLLVVS
jgi:hypothetical protein